MGKEQEANQENSLWVETCWSEAENGEGNIINKGIRHDSSQFIIKYGCMSLFYHPSIFLSQRCMKREMIKLLICCLCLVFMKHTPQCFHSSIQPSTRPASYIHPIHAERTSCPVSHRPAESMHTGNMGWIQYTRWGKETIFDSERHAFILSKP